MPNTLSTWITIPCGIKGTCVLEESKYTCIYSWCHCFKTQNIFTMKNNTDQGNKNRDVYNANGGGHVRIGKDAESLLNRNTEDENQEKCPICWENATPRKVSRCILPCGHWLCGICHFKIVEESIYVTGDVFSCHICRAAYEG